MNKFTKEQVIEKLLNIPELNLKRKDFVNVIEHDGGLINYVFKIETKVGLFFLKQFLETPKTDIFKNFEISSKGRVRHSYKAQKVFEKILNQNIHIVPYVYKFDENENYLIQEGIENIEPIFQKIKKGIFPIKPLMNLAKNIAYVHQQTFLELNNDFDFYNYVCLDWKLKYQFNEMANLLNKENKLKIKNFTNSYKDKRFVLVHGDLCSINIFLSKKNNSIAHIIDFEDAHIGSPAFDLGYLFAEYFVSSVNFPNKREEIFVIIEEFLNVYFEIFKKQDRNQIEIEITMHTACMMLYRTFGLSKNIFTPYIKDEKVRNDIKKMANLMIKNSYRPISFFTR